MLFIDYFYDPETLKHRKTQEHLLGGLMNTLQTTWGVQTLTSVNIYAYIPKMSTSLGLKKTVFIYTGKPLYYLYFWVAESAQKRAQSTGNRMESL